MIHIGSKILHIENGAKRKVGWEFHMVGIGA
jgi:hypothetical protein